MNEILGRNGTTMGGDGMENGRGVVIVGAGQAGSEAAVALRQAGFEGRVVLIGAEPHPPYRRPPLSKAYLTGEASLGGLLIRTADKYAAMGIEFLPGRAVVDVDAGAKLVTLDDGETLGYAKLVLATGGRARTLPLVGSAWPNVFHIRAIADVDRLRTEFQPGRRLTIIGGGFIGLETAAAAIKMGLNVTVLEAADRVLARVASPELSAFCERYHRANGVTLHTGATVRLIEGDGRATGVVTAEGTVPADAVVVSVGLVPETDVARRAGLAVDDGIVTDPFARTSDPDVLAVGDCANHPNGVYGARLRLESVQNAIEQARAAVATIMGGRGAYDPVPWFWSEQYNLKVQMVGLYRDADQTVTRGVEGAEGFSLFHARRGRILAVESINRPQDFLVAKRLVAARIEFVPDQIADTGFALKGLL